MHNGIIVGGVPRLLFNKETGCSLAGWFLFLSAASLYCLAYNQLVLISPASFIDSFLWTLREYAGWLLVTPALFSGLHKIHRSQNRDLLQHYGLLGLVSLAISLSIRLVLGDQEHQSTLARLVDVLPSQLSVLCLLVALWHLFFRTAVPRHISQNALSELPNNLAINLPGNQSTSANDYYQENLRVMKGNGEALISWASVDFISAAGNYMELNCGAEKYLLRITLKELEQQLPAGKFIRVHRSHIVNVAAIYRVNTQNGSSLVELRNHHLVPLSKGYKTALDAIPFVPLSSQ